jgi:hypothetical protein
MSEKDLEDIEKELSSVPSALKPNSNQDQLDFDIFKEEVEEENQQESAQENNLDKKQMLKDSVPSVKEFIKNIKEKVALAQKSKKEELDETAGLDLSAPRKPFFSGEKAANSEPKSLFEQTLRPLSSSEITLLKAEVSADETVFSTMNFNYRSVKVRQQIGLIIALVMVFSFYAAQGLSYFTETLLDLAVPSWTPEIITSDHVLFGLQLPSSVPEMITGEQAQAILFIIGALLPLAAIFIIATSIRNLITGLVDFRSTKAWVTIQSILIGVLGIVLAFACFISLWDREILTGLTYTLIYFILSFINDQIRN